MPTSKSALHALPEKTRGLFETIRTVQGIERFCLVGGSALALRLQHRLSEDLDFMTTGPMDIDLIAGILNQLHASGYENIKKFQDINAALHFDMEGHDADAYSQNWQLDGVKLSFFSKLVQPPQAQLQLQARLQTAAVDGVDCGHVRVASEGCIFALKAQLLSERLTSRDLFDLRTLLETGRYGFEDLLAEAEALGASAEFVKERIVNGRLPVNDPPVNNIYGELVNIDATRHWFEEQVNEYERRRAAVLGPG